MTMRQWLLAAGLVVASALVVFGNRAGDDEAAQPVARGAGPLGGGPVTAVSAAVPPASGPAAPAGSGQTTPKVYALLERTHLIGAAATPQPRGLFGPQSWAPAAKPAPASSQPSAVAAPVAPALPFTYLGRQVQGGTVQVFLGLGEQILITNVPGQPDPNYRIDAASDKQLRFTYLPLNQTQILSTGASD